jgi:hypothetical protein
MAGGSTQDLRERVAKLEALLGVPAEESSSSTLIEQLAATQKAIADLQVSFDEHAAQTLQRLGDRAEEHADLAAHRIEGLSEGIESQIHWADPDYESNQRQKKVTQNIVKLAPPQEQEVPQSHKERGF